jgi:hypothetical protein
MKKNIDNKNEKEKGVKEILESLSFMIIFFDGVAIVTVGTKVISLGTVTVPLYLGSAPHVDVVGTEVSILR